MVLAALAACGADVNHDADVSAAPSPPTGLSPEEVRAQARDAANLHEALGTISTQPPGVVPDILASGQMPDREFNAPIVTTPDAH